MEKNEVICIHGKKTKGWFLNSNKTKQNKTKKKLKAQMDFFSPNIGEVQNLIRMYLF